LGLIVCEDARLRRTAIWYKGNYIARSSLLILHLSPKPIYLFF
jgi:hypothetical protein